MATHRILNLGAGTQSSVLLIMADRGDIEAVKMAIFADTGDEPREVYEHLGWLERQMHNTPIVRVQAGDLVKESLIYQESHKGVDGRYASLPLFTPTGMQPRQCTKYYKVIPIARYVRKHVLGLAVRQHVSKETKVTQLFGISFDERERMAKPRVKFVEHQYPFVDLRWRRHKVIELAEKWFPDHTFPRSACKRCPYRNDQELLDLTPEEFEEVCVYDDAIRTLGPHPSYVHSSRVPLRLVQLKPGSRWDGVRENECDGLCGV